jgi:hypothetical protein
VNTWCNSRLYSSSFFISQEEESDRNGAAATPSSSSSSLFSAIRNTLQSLKTTRLGSRVFLKAAIIFVAALTTFKENSYAASSSSLASSASSAPLTSMISTSSSQKKASSSILSIPGIKPYIAKYGFSENKYDIFEQTFMAAATDPLAPGAMNFASRPVQLALLGTLAVSGGVYLLFVLFERQNEKNKILSREQDVDLYGEYIATSATLLKKGDEGYVDDDDDDDGDDEDDEDELNLDASSATDTKDGEKKKKKKGDGDDAKNDGDGSSTKKKDDDFNPFE